MRYTRYFSLLLLVFVFLYACRKNIEDNSNKFILLSKGELAFTNQGQENITFNIRSNGGWLIKADADWINIDEIKGYANKTISISCQNNIDNYIREGVITVYSPEISESKQIKINQLGTAKDIIAILSQSIFEYKNNEYAQINIVSNVTWKVQADSSWVLIHNAVGGNNYDVPFLVETNPYFVDRKASVFVISTDDVFRKQITITLTQKMVECEDFVNCPSNTLSNFKLIYPQNDALILQNICTIIKNERYILWTPSASSDGLVTSYDIYLDQNFTPTTLIAKNVRDTFYKYDFSQLLEGEYYVRIVAKTPRNLKISSSPYRFYNFTEEIYNNSKIIAGGNGEGNATSQLNYPSDLYVDDKLDIYIADQVNYRIQKWAYGAKEGVTVAGGNGIGSSDKQFQPHSVFFDGYQYLYISDYYNGRVLKWKLGDHRGTVVAGVTMPPISPFYSVRGGDGLNQLSGPMGLVASADGVLFVCDSYNHRIMKWLPGALQGEIVAGGNGKGNALNQLNNPHNLFVDKNENLYIADEFNHRIVYWAKGATQGKVVAGGNGAGNAINQLNKPRSVILDDCSNLYIVDYDNKRVVRWAIGQPKGKVISKGQLSRPHSMVIVKSGDIYIADDTGNLVQKLYK